MGVGRDPAHHVVRGRSDGHELALGFDPGLTQGAHDVGKQRGIDVAHVEVHRSSAGERHLPLDRAGDLVPRRQLVDEPLAGGVQ